MIENDTYNDEGPEPASETRFAARSDDGAVTVDLIVTVRGASGTSRSTGATFSVGSLRSVSQADGGLVEAIDDYTFRLKPSNVIVRRLG